MEEITRTRYRLSASEDEELLAQTSPNSPAVPGTGQRAGEDHYFESAVQTQLLQSAPDPISQNEPQLCMIWLDHQYDDLSFHTTVFNAVRHISHTPNLQVPAPYLAEHAIIECGLRDLFGEVILQDRQHLIFPFQCNGQHNGTYGNSWDYLML